MYECMYIFGSMSVCYAHSFVHLYTHTNILQPTYSWDFVIAEAFINWHPAVAHYIF